MKKRFIGVYNPTIILTYLGVFCAVSGIGLLLSLRPPVYSWGMDIAMILLIVSGVCDMFDGAVARRFKRTEQEKEFGVQLDSLADTVSFVAYPAIILISVTAKLYVSIPIACFYVFAGIMRLGWFNVTTGENKGIYQGLPVTSTSAIFPAFYLLLRLFRIPYLPIVFPVLFGCVGLLFITNFRLKKLGMSAMLCLAALAVVAVAGLLLVCLMR